MSALSESEHVVVAIIQNSKQEVLISRRKVNSHLGGLLEYPGGKVEKNETPANALHRELVEELDIEILKSTPLIQISFSYPDLKILLDAYVINEYSGTINAQEGQEVYWEKIALLKDEDFPAANYGVVRALRLPKLFAVTPGYPQNPGNFLKKFENVISKEHVRMIQLRSHELNSSEYTKLAKQCASLCSKCSVQLILNRDVECLTELQVTGLHLTSNRLLSAKKRPLNHKYLVGASCHNLQEVEHANAIGLDYIYLGPVLEKNSNENTKTLGWEGFAELTRKSLIPVYAIGGLKLEDIVVSIQHGGQGVAAIRSIWDEWIKL